MVLPQEMFCAVGHGDLPAVEAWLRGGGHVDAREETTGATMLMGASVWDNDAVVVELLLPDDVAVVVAGSPVPEAP